MNMTINKAHDDIVGATMYTVVVGDNELIKVQTTEMMQQMKKNAENSGSLSDLLMWLSELAYQLEREVKNESK